MSRIRGDLLKNYVVNTFADVEVFGVVNPVLKVNENDKNYYIYRARLKDAKNIVCEGQHREGANTYEEIKKIIKQKLK